MSEGQNGTTGGRPTSTPNPDPSVLTTEALEREVSYLKEIIGLRIEGLTSLIEEKFARADQQFKLVEGQRIEQKNDTTQAVFAALTAQKEAVREQTAAFALATSKSETAIFKQIDQMAAGAGEAKEALRRTIDEIKDRFATDLVNLREAMVAVDSKVVQASSIRQGVQENRSGLYSAIAAVGVVVGMILAIAASMKWGVR